MIKKTLEERKINTNRRLVTILHVISQKGRIGQLDGFVRLKLGTIKGGDLLIKSKKIKVGFKVLQLVLS